MNRRPLPNLNYRGKDASADPARRSYEQAKGEKMDEAREHISAATSRYDSNADALSDLSFGAPAPRDRNEAVPGERISPRYSTEAPAAADSAVDLAEIQKTAAKKPQIGLLAMKAKGQPVKQVQRMLKELNYLNSEPTSLFDEDTYGGVVRFQQENNLTPDGVIGPKTRSALMDAFLLQAEEAAQVSTPEASLPETTGTYATDTSGLDDLAFASGSPRARTDPMSVP
tara:strand:- start:4864 stop:5544 length:681 start_codon:yes stop_codon:yes gene_type:complete